MSVTANDPIPAEVAPTVQLAVVPATIRVLLADDHPLIIAGIRRLLDGLDDIEVVGEAHSVTELLALAARRAPSIVMMDMRMPDADGASGIELLRAAHPDLKIVVLSACDDRPTIDAALNAGANSYVIKTAHLFDVASVLRQAATGTVFHVPSVPARVADVAQEAPTPLLTERERSILGAVVDGETTAAISRNLWISEHTVKFHLTNIYRKLGVPNRASAVRLALEQGLVA